MVKNAWKNSCLLLQILAVVVTQDLKTTKNWTETKTEMLTYGFKRKSTNFWGFQVFNFALYPKLKTWKSWKSWEKYWEKNSQGYKMAQEEKKTSGISEFSISAL